MLYWPRPAGIACWRVCRRPPMSSPDAGQRFVELLTMMTRLRGDGGCPWDREQTRESLRPFLVEETYEVLDALDARDPRHIREELGDLLFQVVFHAEIARERGEFSMADLLEALVAKMTRRHPHVFGDRPVGSAREALAQWEAIKDAESQGSPRSALAGVPRALPALHRAQRVQHKAARVGFDWADAAGALEKVREELGEVDRGAAAGRRRGPPGGAGRPALLRRQRGAAGERGSRGRAAGGRRSLQPALRVDGGDRPGRGPGAGRPVPRRAGTALVPGEVPRKTGLRRSKGRLR